MNGILFIFLCTFLHFPHLSAVNISFIIRGGGAYLELIQLLEMWKIFYSLNFDFRDSKSILTRNSFEVM